MPYSLLSELMAQADGIGPVVHVGPDAGRLLVVTLGITRIIEQESLDVAIWGSPDQGDWGAKPLTSFPQKFYCGMYSILLNLAARPEIQYVRVHWKMNRWTRGEPTPLFEFYVDVELSGSRIRKGNAGAGAETIGNSQAIAS